MNVSDRELEKLLEAATVVHDVKTWPWPTSGFQTSQVQLTSDVWDIIDPYNPTAKVSPRQAPFGQQTLADKFVVCVGLDDNNLDGSLTNIPSLDTTKNNVVYGEYLTQKVAAPTAGNTNSWGIMAPPTPFDVNINNGYGTRVVFDPPAGKSIRFVSLFTASSIVTPATAIVMITTGRTTNVASVLVYLMHLTKRFDVAMNILTSRQYNVRQVDIRDVVDRHIVPEQRGNGIQRTRSR